MKKYLLNLFFILFSISSFSQSTFQINYSYNMMDIFAGVKRTTNGYALAGAVNGSIPIPSMLVATDTAGTFTWGRKFADGSFFPLTPLFVSDLQKTGAGGYVMTGTFGSNAMLLKVNSAGGTLFSQKYGKTPNESGNAVKEMSAGDYVVAGSTLAKSMNTVKDSTSIYIFKTNSAGAYQWGRSYTLKSPVFDSHDAAVDVAEVSNGYVFTGYISDNNGADTTRNILLFKTDFNGTLQWMESIGAVADNEEGNSIKVLPNGNLLIAGYTSKTAAMDDIALIETDANGNWVNSWAYSVGLGNFAGSVQTTSSGGYALIGWTITSALPLTIKSYLLTLNSSHAPVLCKEYNSTIGGLFSKGEQTPDGGYIIGDMVGTTSYQLHMIKTDANGSVGCNISTVTPTQKVYVPLFTVLTPTVYVGGSGSSFTLNNTAITPTVTVDCINVACAKPNASTNASPSTICAGNNSTLTATGGTSYSWSTGATTSSIVVSPTGTTAYTATVTTGGCDSIPPSVTITVKPKPTAAIGGNTSICTGQSTTLTASGGGTYVWNTGPSTSAITVNPTTNTTYTVTVTGANGCTNSSSATVTMNSLPVANISGTQTVCAGGSATLNASGGSSYSWSTGATTSSITPVVTSTSTYSVTVSNGSCSSSTSVTVTSNPLPAAAISGSTNICKGDAATLTASGGGNYSWSTGATTAVITDSPTSATSYTATVTNASGCSDTATVTVNVLSPPVANVSGNNTICSGQSTTLTATGGGNYSWNTGATTSAINISPTSSSTYSVIVSAGSCADTTSIAVTVNTSPNANIAAASTSICSGQNATLTASGGGTYSWNTSATTAVITVSPTSATSYSVSVSNGLCSSTATVNITVSAPVVANVAASASTICSGKNATLTASGGTTYVWSPSGQTTASITASPASSTNYTVTVSNGSCSDTATVSVTVKPSPTATIVGNNSLCNGQSTTLTASGGGTYAWNPGGQTTNSLSVSPATNTSYTVIVTSANGCTASSISTVTVTPVPTAVISPNITLCSGNATTLTASGGTTYVWNPGGQTNSSIVVNPSSSSNYSVTVANGNCTSTASTSITVNPTPTANAGANITIDYGSSTTLTATGGGTYSWSTGAITPAISVSPTVTTVYCVTVTNANGCTNDTCVKVTIDFNCGELFIPNAFSPNGDMKNDFFVPRNICFKSFNLMIYDRWGVKVFETQDIHSKGWDGMYKGEIGNSAVFGYTFSYELMDGTSGEKKGTVNLMR